MNTEMLDRIMTAKAYQKKAILALFPEEMNGHLEVIEKELKLMAGEVLQAVLCDVCALGSAWQEYYDAGACTNVNTKNDDSEDRRGTTGAAASESHDNRSGTAENAEYENRKGTAEGENGRSGERGSVSLKSRQVHSTRKIEII